MSTRALVFFLAVLVMAVFVQPSVSNSAETKEKLDTLGRMAGEIASRFPRAEGKVVSVDGRKVKLDIGAKDGLKPGIEVFLFRGGKAIRHPVTKAVLGTRETDVGRAVVTQVRESESDAEIKDLPVTLALPGDGCRLSTKRANLVVGVYGPDYNDLAVIRLMDVLKASGRFDLQGPEELPKEPELDAASAAAYAKGKGAEDVLLVKTTPTKKEERTRVDVALYSGTGEQLASIGGVVDAGAEVYGETSMDYQLVRTDRKDFFRMETLPFRGKHMAAGRITGKDRTEFAVSDGKRLAVYAFEKGNLIQLWREQEENGGEHLDLECADMDGDGFDEIYVTNFYAGHMNSYVMEYDGKEFRKLAGPEPLFFRVLDVPGKGRKLITTTIGMDAPYSGVITEYGWKGGSLVKGGVFELPAKIRDPYGFVLVDLMPEKKKDKGPLGGLQIVWIDDSDYIQVLDSKGKRLWKSAERYGGYDTFFELDPKSLALPNADNRGKVKGRLVVRDGAEGGKEIVVTKNIPLTYITRRFRGYNGAEIYSLGWNGKALETRWSITNIEGYLADVFLGDSTNNGRETIAILTEPEIKFEKRSKNLPMGGVESLKNLFEDRSNIVVYKVPQR